MKKDHYLKTKYIRTGIVMAMSLSIFMGLQAQSVPDPLYTFRLNGGSPATWSEQDGTQHQAGTTGTFEVFQDRYGNSQGAVKFTSDNSSIFLGTDIPAIGASTPVTVSFWTYLENLHSYPTGSSPYDKGSMTKLRFFSLSTDYKSGGMARVSENALLGVERKVTNSTTTNPWYLWLYEPATLDMQGWYQVITIFDPHFTKVYVYKPDGSNVCSYNYMGNAFEKRLALGKKDHYPNELVSGAMIIDDLKVWNTALTKEQADAVNGSENILVSGITTAYDDKYYLINHRKESNLRCLQVSQSGFHWNAFIDSDGNENHDVCTKVEVKQKNTGQNSYTLQTEKGYLNLNGPLISSSYRNQTYSIRELDLESSETTLQLYKLSGDPQGGVLDMAIGDSESYSLAYRLEQEEEGLNTGAVIGIAVGTTVTVAGLTYLAITRGFFRNGCLLCKLIKDGRGFGRGRGNYTRVSTSDAEYNSQSETISLDANCSSVN